MRGFLWRRVDRGRWCWGRWEEEDDVFLCRMWSWCNSRRSPGDDRKIKITHVLFLVQLPSVPERTGTSKILSHSRINRAISLTFSGPVYHLMEQLIYKCHIYIFLFWWYIFHLTFCNIPIFAENQLMCKRCYFSRLASILTNGQGITNNCPGLQHDTLFYA